MRPRNQLQMHKALQKKQDYEVFLQNKELIHVFQCPKSKTHLKKQKSQLKSNLHSLILYRYNTLKPFQSQITNSQFGSLPHQLPPTSNSEMSEVSSFVPLEQLSTLPFLNPQYLRFRSLQQQLSEEIRQAQQQQAMMRELFQSIRRMQAGQQTKLKKSSRRCPQEITQKHFCRHQFCNRFYSSESALKRHIKQKHSCWKKKFEGKCQLQVKIDLQSQHYFDSGSSDNFQSYKQKQPKYFDSGSSDNFQSFKQKQPKKKVFVQSEVECK